VKTRTAADDAWAVIVSRFLVNY